MLVSFWTPILLFISIAPAGNIGNCSCAILPSYPQRQGLCKSQLRLIPFSSPQPRSWGDIRRSEIRHLGSLSALKSLSLEATDLSDLGLAAIARLKSLEDLNLGATMVSDRGLAHLAGLVRLRRLRLSDTKVSGDGLKVRVLSVSLRKRVSIKISFLPAAAGPTFGRFSTAARSPIC